MSKLAVPAKFMCSKEENGDLVGTLRSCNVASHMVSDVVWDRRIFRNYALLKVTYGRVRAMAAWD